MTRININGQWHGAGEESGEGSVIIERTFPGAFSGVMLESEWTYFCDEVDETLVPATSLNQKAAGFRKTYVRVMVVLSLAYFLIFFFFISSGNSNREDSYGEDSYGEESYGEDSSIPFAVYPISFMLIYAATLSLIWLRYRSVTKKLQQVMKELELVCEDESKKRPNVSFHVREERITTGSGKRRRTVTIYYIEYSVGPIGPGEHAGFPAPLPPGAPTSMFDQKINDEPEVVVSAVAVPSGGGGIADRLKQLEDIKDIITQEEYTQKRKDILTEI